MLFLESPCRACLKTLMEGESSMNMDASMSCSLPQTTAASHFVATFLPKFRMINLLIQK